MSQYFIEDLEISKKAAKKGHKMVYLWTRDRPNRILV